MVRLLTMTPEIIEAMKGYRGSRFVMLWIWLLVRTLTIGGVTYKAPPTLGLVVKWLLG